MALTPMTSLLHRRDLLLALEHSRCLVATFEMLPPQAAIMNIAATKEAPHQASKELEPE